MSQMDATDVLIVEDDELFAEVLETTFKHHGFEYLTAATGEQALELANRARAKVVVLDIKLPGQSGYLVAQKLLSMTPKPRIIVLTALPRGYVDRMCRFLGIGTILHKPASIHLLVNEIKSCIQPVRKAAA